MKKKDGLLNQVDSLRDQIDACPGKTSKNKNRLLLKFADLLEKLKEAGKASSGGSG